MSMYGLSDRKPKVNTGLESMVKQEFAQEADINNIWKKYRRTGMVTHLSKRQPLYIDCSKVTGYHEALNKVTVAQQAFEELPGELKKRFNHDPAELIAFLQNENNRDEAIKLGMIAKPVEKPAVQPVVPA